MDDFTIQDARGESFVAHPSTQGALSALDWLNEEIDNQLNILDIGCGSGVLSLAASQYWPKARIIATDISPKALVDCSANVAACGLADRITCVRSESAGEAAIVAHAPYSLIMANVLAAYHIRNAAHYQRISGHGAWLILSGIMAWEAEQVVMAAAMVGFQPQSEFRQGEWVSVALSNENGGEQPA